MAEWTLSDTEYEGLSQHVSDLLGLYFPRPRWADLQRGIAASAAALGFREDTPACMRWLISRPTLKQGDLDELSRHLTVGETYFFREFPHFEILAQDILPQLMNARRRSAIATPQIKIWSAACCTGEEAYSLAIWLHRMMPELRDWQVSILGTDINTDFLHSAQAGVFGKWSFRDAPPWLAAEYFHPLNNGKFEIIPEMKKRVTFTPFNLVQAIPGSPLESFGTCDIVFCRNVLMYFSAAQARNVLQKIHSSQPDDGWLIVGASELMHVTDAPYATVQLKGRVVYRRTYLSSLPASPTAPRPAVGAAPLLKKSPAPQEAFRPSPAKTLGTTAPGGRAARKSPATKTHPASARALANTGRLAEALALCEQSLRGDPLHAPHHYLRGLILKERGDHGAAAQAFRRALYLDATLIIAHLALGHLSLEHNRERRSRKYFASALELLHALPPDEAVPESDGMTAAGCIEMIHGLSYDRVTA